MTAVAAPNVFLKHTVPWQVEEIKSDTEDRVKELKSRLAWLQLTIEDVQDKRDWWEIQACFQLELKLDHLLAEHKALEMKHNRLRGDHDRLLEGKALPPSKRTRLS